MALEGVNEVQASAEGNNAVVSLSAEVSNEAMEKAVADAGYKIVGIE